MNADPLTSVFTGIGRYTRSLYNATRENDLADIWYFVNGTVQREMPAQGNKMRSQNLPEWIRPLAHQLRLAWVEYRLSRIIEDGEFDVYHETSLFPIYRGRSIPTVMTLYDLSMILFKECHPSSKVAFFERNFHKRLTYADHILTLSDFIRDEIVNILKLPDDIVTTIPLAADKIFSLRKKTDVTSYLKDKKISGQYILTVGTHEPRKNLTMVARALANLKVNVTWVSAGWSGWSNNELACELTRLGLSNRHLRIGHISDEELVLLLNGATVLVYPSLYEGFGLPVLEAMASGCPVICTNTASLPEVVGGAAVMFEPNDLADLSTNLSKILSDESYQQQLSQSGLRQSNNFSWTNTATQTTRVFDNVINVFERHYNE